MAVVFDFRCYAGAGGEPALLVELLVVGQGDFRHGTQQLALLADEGAVQQAPVGKPPRCADDEDALVGGFCDAVQGRARSTTQIVGEEQIFAGIAADRELRQQHDGGVWRRLAVGLENLVGVGQRIGDGDWRRDGGDLHETVVGVVHRRAPFIDLGQGYAMDSPRADRSYRQSGGQRRAPWPRRASPGGRSDAVQRRLAGLLRRSAR